MLRCHCQYTSDLNIPLLCCDNNQSGPITELPLRPKAFQRDVATLRFVSSREEHVWPVLLVEWRRRVTQCKRVQFHRDPSRGLLQYIPKGEDNMAFRVKNASILLKLYNRGYLGGILAKKSIFCKPRQYGIRLQHSTLSTYNMMIILAHTS